MQIESNRPDVGTEYAADREIALIFYACLGPHRLCDKPGSVSRLVLCRPLITISLLTYYAYSADHAYDIVLHTILLSLSASLRLKNMSVVQYTNNNFNQGV